MKKQGMIFLKDIDGEPHKLVKSENYNSVQNLKTGFFARWGKTKDEDPDFCPFGPEIADIEISTICHGINNRPCPFCYKSNTGSGSNMSLDTFRTILDKMPPTLNQIAFGIGDIDSNPDLWNILNLTRERGIVPNITVNGWNLTDEYAEKLANVCGAVSVSNYGDDICFNAIEKLAEYKDKEGSTLQQINIHQLAAHETMGDCFSLMENMTKDERLKNLNAVVFLALKPKGKRNTYHPISKDEYNDIVKFAFENNLPIGFDSCGAPLFFNSVKKYITDEKKIKEYDMLAESCESYLFSFYINNEGKTVPCSFLEGEGYAELDVVSCENFLKDIWYNPEVVKWRDRLIKNVDENGYRECLQFDIYNNKKEEIYEEAS